MELLEHQVKTLLLEHGCLIPEGHTASTPENAERAACCLNAQAWIVKAQVPLSARKKQGGIQKAFSLDTVYTAATSIFNTSFFCPKTKRYYRPTSIYVEALQNLQREFYISFMIDGKSGTILCRAISEGGSNIEERASHPLVVAIDTENRWSQWEYIAHYMKVPTHLYSKYMTYLDKLYKAFIHTDMICLEINPFALTTTENFMILDARARIDTNALYRHKNIAIMQDSIIYHPLEIRAQTHGFTYVKMHGTIGCIANGAGLAMATLDSLRELGGEAANFLDIGGNASEERIHSALKLVSSDPQVRCILCTMFGGIVDGNMVAEAIRKHSITCPLVVYLQGEHADTAQHILRNTSAKCYTTLEEAIKTAISLGVAAS